MQDSTLILGLVAVSLLINLITLILVIKSTKRNKIVQVQDAAFEQSAAAQSTIPVQANSEPKAPSQAGIVFCRKCGKQYDSTQAACPSCKTARDRGTGSSSR